MGIEDRSAKVRYVNQTVTLLDKDKTWMPYLTEILDQDHAKLVRGPLLGTTNEVS